MDAEGRERRAAYLLNALPVPFEEPDQLNGSVGGLFRGRFRAFQKKGQPLFPDPLRSDALEQVIVHAPMHFEIQAQVQQRVPQCASCAEQERNQQASHSISRSGGGGTNAAFPGRVPPIQF